MAVTRGVRYWIQLIAELGKIRIALLVTMSSFAGYVLSSGKIDLYVLVPTSGVFLLALGSGAINQYQERDMDGLMHRTTHRPVPAGKISEQKALLIGFLLLLMGAFTLAVGTNLTALLLGLLTVIWYNGVYTYLKRVTALAVIPGSFIGSLPPLIGWASFQSNIFSSQPLVLALFFFIWQIPHFWLLLLNFGSEYSKAGFPSLTNILNETQLSRLTFMWIIATSVSVILFPLFGLGNSLIGRLLLFLLSILLIWRSTVLLHPVKQNSPFMGAFKSINLFILAVMVILALDRLSVLE